MKYKVVVQWKNIQTYNIEAPTEEEALQLAMDGEGNLEDDNYEIIDAYAEAYDL